MHPDETTHRPEAGSSDRIRIELFVRSLSGGAVQTSQESVIERLSRLERSESVDEFTVHVWGRQVSPDTAAAHTSVDQFVLARIETFRDWARRTGSEVDSFFATHEVDSSITGESYTAITTPSLTLAEFHGDELHRVTPFSDGETVHTVDDHLDALDANTGSDREETGGPGHPPTAAADAQTPRPGERKG